MPVEIRKKEGESAGTLIYRFTKKVQQSGIVKEAKRRRFTHRYQSRIKRRLSAIHRAKKAKEVEKMKKLGLI